MKDAQAKYDSDITKRDSRAETEKLLSAHKFINEITRNHYVDAVEKAMDDPANKGKGRDELFKALTQDKDGKPLDGVFLQENPNRLPGPAPAGNIPRAGDDIAAKVAARYAAAKAE